MIVGKGFRKKVLENVSFVTTVYNEEISIISFLRSLMGQSSLPGEIIIVDGGSTDDTLRKILRFFKNRARKNKNLIVSFVDSSAGESMKAKSEKEMLGGNLSDPRTIKVKIIKRNRVNISTGRNEAIKNTSGKIICVSDSGCILSRDWLSEISRFYSGPLYDVVGGFNLPLCSNFTQKCLAACIMPLKEEISSDSYMPSSRNLSFRKEVWSDVGGYPENMDYGEDMKFNFNIRKEGYRIRFNPDALVYWVMRENPVQIFRQFFRYATGDAAGKMYAYRHIIRFTVFLVFILIILLAAYVSGWILFAFLPLFVFYIYKSYRRLFRLFKNKKVCYFNAREKLLSILFIPLLLVYIDISKMCGYIYGIFKSIID